MTSRSRLDRLAADHACPACAGTGIAAPAGQTITDPIAVDAGEKMLDLIRSYADEYDHRARQAAEALPAHDRGAGDWALILPADLTGRDLVARLLDEIEGAGADG